MTVVAAADTEVEAEDMIVAAEEVEDMTAVAEEDDTKVVEVEDMIVVVGVADTMEEVSFDGSQRNQNTYYESGSHL